MIDGMNQLPAQSYFYQKDMIVSPAIFLCRCACRESESIGSDPWGAPPAMATHPLVSTPMVWAGKQSLVRASSRKKSRISSPSLSHDGSMVLVYMRSHWGYIDGIHVTIYSSTMDPMGMGSICLYKSSPVMVKRTLKALLLFFYRKTSWIDSWGLFQPQDLGMLPSGCSRRPLRQVALQL